MTETTDRPFPVALEALLRERGYVTKLGSVNYAAFARDVRGVHYETLRKILVGERQLQPEVIEAVAAALDKQPCFFVEYRLHLARSAFDVNEVGLDQAQENLRRWLAARPDGATARRRRRT